MGGATNVRFASIDDRPMKMLSMKERKECFDREIGPDIDKLSDEDIKLMRKAYLLDQNG